MEQVIQYLREQGIKKLALGDTGKGVEMLQQVLAAQWYTVGTYGTFDEQTQEAVRLYNATNGVQSDTFDVPPKEKPVKKAPKKRPAKKQTKKEPVKKAPKKRPAKKQTTKPRGE